MKRTVGLGSLVLLLAGGCSFILDFPTHDTAADGGAGGGGAGGLGGSDGGGGAGGTGPTICEEFAPEPSFDKVALHGVTAELGFREISTSGLARDTANDVLYAFGKTSGGLEGFFPPKFDYSEDLFLLAIPEVGDPTLAMLARSCVEISYAVTGRVTLLSDGRQVVGGALGFDFENAFDWSIDVAGDLCATAPISVLGTSDWSNVAHPFFALVDGAAIGPSFGGGMGAPTVGSDGVGADVDDNATNLGSIGTVTGGAFDAPAVAGQEPKFFVQRSTESTSDTTFILDDHVQPFSPLGQAPEAAVAVDDDGSVWFGGGSCEAQFPCEDQGAFIGMLAKVGSPTLLVERPGVSSGVTAMDYADHVVVMGGRYIGALEMMGVQFPDAGSNDAFVMAIDSVTQDVLWSYPDGATEPGYDLLGHDTVVDLAVLGDRECGAVYVLGCEVPGEENANCVLADVGKSGFILKLDLATGARVWIQEIELENPDFDYFLPTALTAADDKVWLAATLLGSVNVAGGTVSADEQESVIVKLSK